MLLARHARREPFGRGLIIKISCNFPMVPISNSDAEKLRAMASTFAAPWKAYALVVACLMSSSLCSERVSCSRSASPTSPSPSISTASKEPTPPFPVLRTRRKIALLHCPTHLHARQTLHQAASPGAQVIAELFRSAKTIVAPFPVPESRWPLSRSPRHPTGPARPASRDVPLRHWLASRQGAFHPLAPSTPHPVRNLHSCAAPLPPSPPDSASVSHPAPATSSTPQPPHFAGSLYHEYDLYGFNGGNVTVTTFMSPSGNGSGNERPPGFALQVGEVQTYQTIPAANMSSIALIQWHIIDVFMIEPAVVGQGSLWV
ncbi:hypothetical protein B0H12DRAFT_1320115 [Mycena haematopus]|nr:hypothetical protein B0H12DRAFT_1320115 [Mycena haematopus]